MGWEGNSGKPRGCAPTGESASSGGRGHGGGAPGGLYPGVFVLAGSVHGRRGGSGRGAHGAGCGHRCACPCAGFPWGNGKRASPGSRTGRGGWTGAGGGASWRGGHGGAERAPPLRGRGAGRARPPARALRARAWPRREKRRWRRRAAAQRRAASPCTISAGSWASSGCTSTPCGCGTRSSSGWAPRPPWPAWLSPCAAPV